MSDPISDMLARIRNAGLAGHPEVLVPSSRIKLKIAEILEGKRFVEGITEENIANRKYIRLALKYIKDEKGRKTPYIQGLRRVSRQGQRIYSGRRELPIVRSGFGFSIVSTSKGLMATDKARKAGVGGEIICEIW